MKFDIRDLQYKLLGEFNFVRICQGKHLAEDLGVDGRITLEWLLEKWGGKLWTDFICLGIGTSGGVCEHGNEPSGYTKGGKFLD
jgi:hypothetical protein